MRRFKFENCHGEFVINFIKCAPPASIKHKINLRNRLLKKLKILPNPDLNKRVKNLNAEIRTYFHGQKKKKVRKGIIPGNSKSLWDAVKIANFPGVYQLLCIYLPQD